VPKRVDVTIVAACPVGWWHMSKSGLHVFKGGAAAGARAQQLRSCWQASALRQRTRVHALQDSWAGYAFGIRVEGLAVPCNSVSKVAHQHQHSMQGGCSMFSFPDQTATRDLRTC
jgi:hypothetical protein